MTTVRLDPRRLELIGIALIAVLILILLPLVLDIFRLNLVGKYLTYAFVAIIGLVLCWGQTGILSLGQGLFFGLGGYCMAAFLKLEASSVANTKIQSTPGIPDFMDWNQLTALPFFWVPFKWLPFALVAVIAVPTILAFILGAALFKRRVGGVYFAIITQALALVMTILIVGQQGYTGGINGITDLRTLLGWDIRTDSAKYILYFASAASCSLARCSWRASCSPASSAESSSPSATRRIASVSPATTWPTTRFSCSAWRPPWRASAARCSRCKSASCRRPSSASCRPSTWSSSVRLAAETPSLARSPARSW